MLLIRSLDGVVAILNLNGNRFRIGRLPNHKIDVAAAASKILPSLGKPENRLVPAAHRIRDRLVDSPQLLERHHAFGALIEQNRLYHDGERIGRGLQGLARGKLSQSLERMLRDFEKLLLIYPIEPIRMITITHTLPLRL